MMTVKSEEVDKPSLDSEHGQQMVPCVDLTEAFTTNQAFASHTDLVNWAKNVGKEHGYVVIVSRSDYGSVRRKPMITLGCERGGEYTPAAVLKRKQTGTKKCGCPFKLRARPSEVDKLWRLNVHSGIHNHDTAEILQGHSYVGRLNPDEKAMVGEMIEERVKPSDILIAIRKNNPNNLTRIKQIYNEKQAYNRLKRGPLSEMQHLMKLLEGDKYAHWSRVEDGTDVIRSLFWSHPDCIHLFNEFPTVVLMDSTYKTNRYRIPLLEMVGVTSTNLTYSIAFAYMANEQKDEVLWAVNRLKDLIVKEDNLPKVFVTDKDKVLVGALETVFPAARHLLCQFHVAKSVTGKLKTMCQSVPRRIDITDKWNRLMYATNEEDYNNAVGAMQSTGDFWPYIEANWLPLRRKFVKFEIDTCMHMGCTTTNRVEGAHSKLKKLLSDSKGDLVTAWTAVNKLIIMQHDKIKESFQLSIFVTEHALNDMFYKHLRGFVSRAALHMIVKERKRIGRIGVEGSLCGCEIRRTHGLPCACELVKFDSIPLLALHPHWRKLTWDSSDPYIDPELGVSFEAEISTLRSKFDAASPAMRLSIIESLRVIAYPETTSMCPPPKKIKTKGRTTGSTTKARKKEPKGSSQTSTKRIPSLWEHIDMKYPGSWHDSNTTPIESSSPKMKPEQPQNKKLCTSQNQKLRQRYLKQIPAEFHPFIVDFVHVRGDGHCGFRCVAALMGLGEDDWLVVRRTLLAELDNEFGMYSSMFGLVEANEIRDALHVNSTAPVGEDKWMTVPNMAYLISTAYKVILMTLSISGCSTFFPMRGAPDPLPRHRIMAIAFVDKNHFMGVVLRDGHPMPITAHMWKYRRHDEAKGWEAPYKERIDAYDAYLTKKMVDVMML